jgi:antitoxin CptB
MNSPPSAGGAPAQGVASSGPAAPDPRLPIGAGDRLGEQALSKLRWRCRRGLLENDLFVQRFFDKYQDTLTTRQAAGLEALMDLADNDLLDLLLRRREPPAVPELHDTPETRDVLALMRNRPLF